MKKFWKFTIASIKMFFRNRQALFFSLFMPIMIMVVFGLIDFGKMGSTRIEIVDKAKNESSEQFIEGLRKVDVLEIESTDDLEKAKEKLVKGDTDMVLELDKNVFTINPLNPETKKVKIFISQASIQQGQIGVTVIKEVFTNLEHELTQSKPLFEIKTEEVSTLGLEYIDFLVPGIVALAIMQMSLFSIIFVVVAYKKTGVMRRLLVTPIKSYQFIGGQVATRLVVSIMQITVIILLAVFAFNVNVIGSYWLIALLVFWGSIIFLALGLALASFAKTEEAAAPIANIIALPQMFLGNVFFPIEAMPDWLQGIVKYLPLNYLADSLRKVMTEGAGIADISGDMWGLVAWSVITIGLAIIFFRWQEE